MAEAGWPVGGGAELRAAGLVATAGGLLVIADQVLQVVVGLGDLDPGVASWRFRAGVLVAGRSMGVVLGALAVVAGHLAGRRPAPLRVWRGIILGLAVVAAAAAATLLVDASAVGAQLPDGQTASFAAGRLRSLIGATAGMIGLLLLGWAAGPSQTHT